MSRPAVIATSLNRVPLIRHLALCAAALAAYAMREELRVGNSVLWIFGLAALLNLQTAVFSSHPRVGPVLRWFSPAFGLGGWMALMMLTGGVASPFIAGLWLEIALAATTCPPAGLAVITVGAVAGIWGQQALLGLEGVALTLTLQSGFLVIMGGLTGYLAHQWRRAERRLSSRLSAQCDRLEQIEQELDEVRAMGRLGEGVARLAHGYKNSVHSLRGFAQLIEPRLSGSRDCRRILVGLRTAIDRLETLTRTALGPPGPSSGLTAAGEEEMRRLVHEVVREAATSFPDIQWSVSLGRSLRSARTPPAVLREVLTIVVRNAAEATRGRGEVAVEAIPNETTLEIRVRDRGPGIAREFRGEIFRPGFTTKPEGHGFGLFLARRLLNSSGGLLNLMPAQGGGTLCSIQMPLAGPSRST